MSSHAMLAHYQLKLEPAEYEYLKFMRGLAKDDDGELVLVGLTLEESLWYTENNRRWLFEQMTGRFSGRDDREKYLALNDRYERARLEQVMARAGEPEGESDV